jgi:hypothetical protein
MPGPTEMFRLRWGWRVAFGLLAFSGPAGYVALRISVALDERTSRRALAPGRALPTSPASLADGSQLWPASASAFASGDLAYADGTPYAPGVGQPGIAATYKNGSPFYPPKTSLAPNSPTAAQASMVLRTQVQLSGTSTSCTNQVGKPSLPI